MAWNHDFCTKNDGTSTSLHSGEEAQSLYSRAIQYGTMYWERMWTCVKIALKVLAGLDGLKELFLSSGGH